MTATFDSNSDTQTTTEAPTRRSWRNSDEPWPIWAAILVFLNIVVIAAKFWGLAGLVTVMVPAAIGMLVVLLLVVRG